MFRLLHEPAVAIAIAAVFAILLTLRRGAATRALRVTVICTIAIWIAFATYEWRMNEWERTVVAPIRIDLLVALPLLAIVSLIGIAALLPRKQ
jgi:EamA domain-containing membrane protein RarD